MGKIIKPLFLCLAWLLGSQAFAQAPNVERLEQQLLEASSDSVKIKLLIALSEAHQYNSYAKALEYATQAQQLAEQYKQYWAVKTTFRQMGLLSAQTGDFSTAMKIDNQNLTYAMEAKDSAGIAEILNFLGNDYLDMGQYDEAYYYFTQSFRVAKAINDSMKMNFAIHNVGSVFKEMGQYDIALNHYKTARSIGEKLNDEDGLAYLYDESGDVYLRRKEYALAEENLMKALKVVRERKIQIVEPRTLSKLAKLAFARGQYEKALAYYDSTQQLHKNNAHEYGLADSQLGKAEVFMAQGKFKDAQALVQQSLAMAQQVNAYRLEIRCYDLLSRLAERENNLKSALAYYKQFKTMEDSAYSQKTMEKLFQNQLRFETENKDSEIALLSQTQAQQASELKRQEFIRNIFVVVFALTAILLFTVYRSGQRRIRINKLLLEHQEEIKRRSLELEQLNQVKDKFFSIISHDLRSPMNALAAILDMADKKQLTADEFAQLTKELRIQFNHTKTLINNLLDWTLLQMDKLKIQEDRVDLRPMVDENFRLLSSLHLKDIQMINEINPGTFAKADTNMVNLVFRNLILNGIKFTDAGGSIKVAARPENGMIVVSVADNGVGIAPEVQSILFEKTSGYSTRGTANEKGTGLGLILCKEFVEKNGGTIWLESEPGKGSTFYFTVKQA